jgi:RND family efflux transporter MFP subunit
VREGQVLAELEANDVRAAISRARATLASTMAGKLEAENAVVAAESASELARTTHDRASRLLEQNAIARAEFDEAQAGLRSATATERMTRARLEAVDSSIDQARAAIAETRAMLEYTKIVAPFGGRVLERLVDQGALATPGTPLLVVTDDAGLRVEAPVPESHAAALALGHTVSIELENAATVLSGTVAEIVPNVDVAARAFLIKIDLPESRPDQFAALRPGSFARAAFPVASARRLAVPDSALSRFGAIERVFVVENGKARLRLITTGESQGSFTAVLSGLAAGERVVLNPPANLRDASPVEEKP